MDPNSTSTLVLCTFIFEMLIRKHMQYVREYDTDEDAVILAAHNWAYDGIEMYERKLKELARAPLPNELKIFEYRHDFTVVTLKGVKESTHKFLGDVHGNDGVHIDPRQVNHFMQEACEYLFRDYQAFYLEIENQFSMARETLRLRAERLRSSA